MTLDQFIQWIHDHVADEQAATHDLDELVHDAKADEAADINNSGIESQLRYLLGDDSATVSSSTMREYCQRMEVPLPREDAAEATSPEDAWAEDDQQAAFQNPELARTVYEVVLGVTASFEDDRVGADLAYLLGAILKGNQCEWPKDRPLVRLLREHYAPGHLLWRYIEIEEEEP